MLPFHPHTPDQPTQNKNNDTFNWDATSFFEDLTKRNKFAQSKHFTFCRVSGLDGFEEALAKMLTKSAFVCVSDISQGFTDINNTPHTRRVKTVFLAMRHTLDNMVAAEGLLCLIGKMCACDLFPLNNQKPSPVCFSLPQFALVNPIYS